MPEVPSSLFCCNQGDVGKAKKGSSGAQASAGRLGETLECHGTESDPDCVKEGQGELPGGGNMGETL